MDHKLEDIVEIPLLQELQDKLNVIYSCPSAIIDIDGKILTAVAWQDVCTKFHRINSESEKECIKSDQFISEHLHEANPAVSYQCPHGMVDNATPIIINGKHLGNFFTGQFFLEKPDADFFRKQAARFGFDEVEYLKAVEKVPIWEKEKLNQYQDFIKGFIEIITSIGLKNLREIEVNRIIKESEERYRQLFETSPDGIVHIGSDGLITRANIEEARMFGYNSPDDLIGFDATLLVGLTSREYASQIMFRRLSGENLPPVEYELVRLDGTIFYGEVSASILRNIDGSVSGYICITHNTTERRQAEILLRKREEEFRSTFEQSGVGMAHVGINGQWIRVNNCLCEMLGYSQEELLSKTFQDITCSADLFIDTHNLQQLANNEIQSFSREKRYVRKDGTLIWASLTSSAFRDNSGDLEYIISIIKDISDRKEVELNLLKSEEKFAKAFRMSPEAISIVSMEDGRYIDINYIFCETIGYKREELVGHSAMELNVWVNLKDRAIYLDALRTKGILKTFDTQYRMRSGEIRDFIVSGETFEFEGEKCSLNFSLDITERKRVEVALIKSDEKFRALFEGSNDALMTLNPFDGKFTSCNKSTLEMFRVNTVKQFIEYRPSEFSPERQSDESFSNEKSLKMIELAMSNESHNFEWTHKRLDGEEFPATVLLTKIELEESIFLLATVRDITAKKKAETELEKHRNHLEDLVKLRTEEWEDTNEELQIQIEKQNEYELLLQQSLVKEQELNEMKSRFIATTSHEFKTPLTSIMTSAGMIQRYADRWTPEKRNEHLDRIQRSVLNLSNLVDDVLTISKTEEGKISYNPEPIDLYELAVECLDEVKLLMAGNHKLKFDYKSEREQFDLDPKLMKFVFNNLLSNSVKYSPDGGIIELEIDSDEKYLRIKVKDEGIGIPSEEIEKIFDSFFRTKNAEEIKGTGLGLTIVKRAVDLHCGEITVLSELNIGTTITVKIPVL